MSRKSGTPTQTSAAKKFKTAHSSLPKDSLLSNHLSFRTLADILEPNNPTSQSTWRSIVDREEHLIVYYKLDYKQLIPRLAKCIRIQRERSMTSKKEFLHPSVYFGTHLDRAIVQDCLGRPYLMAYNEIQMLLDAADDSRITSKFDDDSDGERESEEEEYPIAVDDDVMRDFTGGIKFLNNNNNTNSVDEEPQPMFPRLLVTDIHSTPSVDSNLEGSEYLPSEEESLPVRTSQIPPKRRSTVTIPQNIIANVSFQPQFVPDGSMVTFFNPILEGDTEPSPGPLLECQASGPGLVPITMKGFQGKNLYCDKNQLDILQRDWKDKPSSYLKKLFDKLLSAKGFKFASDRKKERKARIVARGGGKPEFMTAFRQLVSEDVVNIMHVHMEETGLKMSLKKMYKILNFYWGDLFRRQGKKFALGIVEDAFQSLEHIRQGLPLNDSELPPAISNNIFLRGGPVLECEKPGETKVPLINPEENDDYSGSQLYLEEAEMAKLRKRRINATAYAAFIFKALLKDEGMSYLLDKRKELTEITMSVDPKKRPPTGVKKMFTENFITLIRVHMSQNDYDITYTDLNSCLASHISYHKVKRENPKRESDDDDDDSDE